MQTGLLKEAFKTTALVVTTLSFTVGYLIIIGFSSNSYIAHFISFWYDQCDSVHRMLQAFQLCTI